MVKLTQALESNARISSDLPSGLVAVFVGGTSGIGEFTLRAFVKYAQKPHIYIVGRSQEAADRIITDCKKVNADGQFVFIPSDVALVKNVDAVCRDIKNRETAVNLLFLTQGTLMLNKTTSEGIPLHTALATQSRARFIANLLPLLQNATSLRRVVSVLAATKEGAVDLENLPAVDMSFTKMRDQGAATATLWMEEFARRAPSVGFVHTFPGAVKSGIMRGTEGLLFNMMKGALQVFGPLVTIPPETSGAMNLFAATSARYVAAEDAQTGAGVPLDGGISVSKGTDGKEGSGMYSIDQHDEPAGPAVLKRLAQLRKDGVAKKVWDYIDEDFQRTTGSSSI